MSHKLTAAKIQNMSPYSRLGLYVRLRQASGNRRLASSERSGYRTAARYVLGSLNNAAYDIMIRLQVLEGVYKGTSAMKPAGGTWYRQDRRGLAAARDAFAGTDIDPSWLSPGNTGMIGKIIGMIGRAHKSWSSQYTMHKDVDDMIADMIMGLGSTGVPMPQGPVAIQLGARNPAINKGITSGKETPKNTAGPLGKMYVQKMGDLREIDKNQAPNVTETGSSIFDRMQSGEADLFEVLTDLLSDPRSPVKGLIEKHFRAALKGDGKWADIAAEWFMLQLNGVKVKNQDLAKKHGMEPGTYSSILKRKVKPAIAVLKKNQQFQNQVMTLAERAQGRRAHLRLATRVVRACNKHAVQDKAARGSSPQAWIDLYDSLKKGSRVMIAWTSVMGRSDLYDGQLHEWEVYGASFSKRYNTKTIRFKQPGAPRPNIRAAHAILKQMGTNRMTGEQEITLSGAVGDKGIFMKDFKRA